MSLAIIREEEPPEICEVVRDEADAADPGDDPPAEFRHSIQGSSFVRLHTLDVLPQNTSPPLAHSSPRHTPIGVEDLLETDPGDPLRDDADLVEVEDVAQTGVQTGPLHIGHAG